MQRHADIPGMAEAVGPFSQSVVANGFVFVSGQIPTGVGGIGDQPEDFESKVRRTLENLRSVLEAAGTDMDHVVKCNGYLTRPEQLDTYNQVYAEFFADSRPARTTVGVNLWGVDLEIDCMAVLPGAGS
ncbi:RidA family protein [Paenarthrobacter sp. AMU7]|uniref:RidA family protein n=1 Tax=Paenarthrobacter sp. AMU7 TaxID=3162492 RepID=A0AB39YNH2_9MICC